ncbi:hypothetical protein [Vulcaniibacterium gelatinicum]|uniref:hypothetical protein n=1 Tax=Vulcaniibacterium gelatinicum TaxID=2598725 RepID=UPI001C702103|nr:hypothetical protein [Vulcaniibacterium gelatinicum]
MKHVARRFRTVAALAALAVAVPLYAADGQKGGATADATAGNVSAQPQSEQQPQPQAGRLVIKTKSTPRDRQQQSIQPLRPKCPRGTHPVSYGPHSTDYKCVRKPEPEN